MANGGLKARAKNALQRALGLERYLYWFARWSLLEPIQRRREAELYRLLDMLPARGTVLDVGACLGTTTVPLARARPETVVHAIEPHPVNYRVLQRVVGAHRLSNVRLHAIAAGAERSASRLVMPEAAGVRLHGLTHVVHATISEFNEGETLDVQTVALDEHLELGSIQPPLTAIKIDVENFEYFALLGCRAGIERFRPIILCELWENENKSRVFELLEELGYRASVLRGGRLVPYRAGEMQALDYFFLPVSDSPTLRR